VSRSLPDPAASADWAGARDRITVGISMFGGSSLSCRAAESQRSLSASCARGGAAAVPDGALRDKQSRAAYTIHSIGRCGVGQCVMARRHARAVRPGAQPTHRHRAPPRGYSRETKRGRTESSSAIGVFDARQRDSGGPSRVADATHLRSALRKSAEALPVPRVGSRCSDAGSTLTPWKAPRSPPVACANECRPGALWSRKTSAIECA